MRASTSERHVRVGISAEVKREWVGESTLVVISGDVPHHDLVAGRDRDPSQLRVADRCPSEMDLGASPSKDLFCRGAHQVGFFSQPVQLIGKLCQGQGSVAQAVAGGLVPRDNQQKEKGLKLRGS